MGCWQFFDKDSYTSIHCGGYPRGTDRKVARLRPDTTQPGLSMPNSGRGIHMGAFASTTAESGVALVRPSRSLRLRLSARPRA